MTSLTTGKCLVLHRSTPLPTSLKGFQRDEVGCVLSSDHSGVSFLLLARSLHANSSNRYLSRRYMGIVICLLVGGPRDGQR